MLGFRAQRVRDALRRLTGAEAGPSDWSGLGCPEWLASRAERLGFSYPTGAAVLQAL